MSGIAFRYGDSPINIRRMSDFAIVYPESFNMKKDGARPTMRRSFRSFHERSIS